MKDFKRIFIYSLLFLFTINIGVIAQAPPGDVGAPIDGGVGFLLAAGVAYAVNRLWKQKKKIN